MGTLVFTYAFPSTSPSAEGFSATVGANTIASWQSADGTVNGCLQFRISGRAKTNANNRYTRTLTFEDMGVPAGATVTGITSASAYFRCREWNAGAATGNRMDGVFLTPSGSSQITLAAATGNYTGTSSWAQATGTDSAGLSLASTTSCLIAWQADLATAANNGAYVTLACDTITFTVTYSLPATANPTTVFGTGGAGEVTQQADADADVVGVSATGGAGSVGFGTYGPGLTLVWSLNLDQNDFVSVLADAPTVSGTGGIGTAEVTTTGSVSADVTGTIGYGFAGTASTPAEGYGSWLIFSLNLLPGEPGATVYKYTSDTWTPTFTEDDLDEVTITDDTEAFTPVWLESGQIILGGGSTAFLTGVGATVTAAAADAYYGCTARPSTAEAITDISQLVTATGTAAVSITTATGYAYPGTATVEAGGSVSVSLGPVDSTGTAGDVTVTETSTSSADATGVEATGYAGMAEGGTPIIVSITGVDATTAVATYTVTGTANVTPDGIYGTGGAGFIIVNPGQDGNVIRRRTSIKPTRLVSVSR